MVQQGRRLTVASNRLPVTLVPAGEGDGGWRIRRSVGGLVSAVRPVLEEWGGTWIGWSGVRDLDPGRLEELVGSAEDGFDLKPVPLTAAEYDGYYLGYANRMLWPVLHGLPEYAEARPGDWNFYRQVNVAFARALASCGPGPVWIHDYHLMLVGEELRRLGDYRRLGFFLHTPFPEPEVVLRLPQGEAIVRALTGFHSIGFQTPRDRANFLATAREVGRDGVGRRWADSPSGSLEERARALPISIDAVAWSRRAAGAAVTARAREIRREAGVDQLLLGVDRLDYTKGIPEKLNGYACALERYPSLRGRVVLRQLAIPSRQAVPAYAALRREVEGWVRTVNRRFGTPDWTPVELVLGTWDREELTAQYRAADVLLVTSLRDGMNLVAKEFAACNGTAPGVLVLSRFTGAAAQLGDGAILVDPGWPEEVGGAIYQAVGMERGERHRRMTYLRRTVRRADVRAWAEEAMAALWGTDVGARWGETRPSRNGPAPTEGGATRRRRALP